jgi:hypothetical protein
LLICDHRGGDAPADVQDLRTDRVTLEQRKRTHGDDRATGRERTGHPAHKRLPGDGRPAVERSFSRHGRILNLIVRRYSGHSGEPYEDLNQVGYAGPIKAVNTYKTDCAGRLDSYASR